MSRTPDFASLKSPGIIVDARLFYSLKPKYSIGAIKEPIHRTYIFKANAEGEMSASKSSKLLLTMSLGLLNTLIASFGIAGNPPNTNPSDLKWSISRSSYECQLHQIFLVNLLKKLIICLHQLNCVLIFSFQNYCKYSPIF